MNYFSIALLTTGITAIALYFLLNKALHIKIRIIPLVLCVACSLFISITLPKVILRYTDWLGTLAVLLIFSVIIAYFLAYYEGNLEIPQTDAEPQVCFNSATHDNLPVPILIPGQDVSSRKITTPETIDGFPTPETFDEQLELAFYLKEQRHFSAAAILFQNVLQANPNSEATPLLILQIADSLKNAKKYQQAIDVLTKYYDFSSAYDMETKRQLYGLLTKIQYQQNTENTGGV